MTSHWRDCGLERYRKVDVKMNELIRFDWKYHANVQDYLDSHDNLHRRASFGGESHIYLTHKGNSVNGTIKGLVMQKSCTRNEGVVYRVNNHPAFDKIKKDLAELTKSK